MRHIRDIYPLVNEVRQRIIKAMQERGLKELNLVMSKEEWAKDNDLTLEDEDDYDGEYDDYKCQEAPYVIYFDKYDSGSEYKAVKVELEGNEHPRFKMECEGSYDNDTFYDDDVTWLSMLNVYETMEQLLELDDESEYVWVFTANQATDDQELDTITEVFATEEAAQKHLHDFVYGDEGELAFAEKRGWTVEENCADWFQAYEEGYYCGNHTEASVEKREVKH